MSRNTDMEKIQKMFPGSGQSFLARLCCLAGALMLSACGPEPEPVLRIGSNTWPGYEPLYLARSLGEYEGSRIRLVELTSASEVLHKLRSGTLEGAALTLDESLILLDDGFDLKVILIMDFSNGGDVLLAKPGIASLEDLRGKRIAVETTAAGGIVLDSALRKGGLKPEDVEIVPCPIEDHVDCYPGVDAVVTFEPVRTKLKKQGAVALFDSSEIPERIVDVLVVKAEVVETHPRSLHRLLEGYFKAREHLASKPDAAAELMAVRLGLSPGELLAAYEGVRLPELEENRKLLTGGQPPLERTAEDLRVFMLERNLLQSLSSIGKLADGRFLPSDEP